VCQSSRQIGDEVQPGSVLLPATRRGRYLANIVRRQAVVSIFRIDLVLIDQQSVGKRSHHLINTVNAKKKWTIIYWRVNKLLKESHLVTRLALE
jgi:hypothetical protein